MLFLTLFGVSFYSSFRKIYSQRIIGFQLYQGGDLFFFSFHFPCSFSDCLRHIFIYNKSWFALYLHCLLPFLLSFPSLEYFLLYPLNRAFLSFNVVIFCSFLLWNFGILYRIFDKFCSSQSWDGFDEICYEKSWKWRIAHDTQGDENFVLVWF